MNIIFLYFNVVLLINESRSTISILLIGNKITVVKSKYYEQGQVCLKAEWYLNRIWHKIPCLQLSTWPWWSFFEQMGILILQGSKKIVYMKTFALLKWSL